MSYDLEVRADGEYSRAVPLAEMVSVVGSLPGVTSTGPGSFVLDRLAAGIHVNIDLSCETDDEDEAAGELEQVNSVAFSVPYPLLAKTGPVALEMAFQIAERLGWSVYDPQGDCDLTRESSGAALAWQGAAGDAARDVLERAAAAEASLGDLFQQEMWNHSLLTAASAFVAVAIASIWLMFSWGWPKERFERYLPWAVAIGGLGVLWLKAFARAYLRLRRRRGPTNR